MYHTTKITEKLIAAMTKCRGIIRCGVGYDNVDLEAAGKRGIVVCNVPDYGTEEVADHALMMLLAIARRLIPARSGDSRRQLESKERHRHAPAARPYPRHHRLRPHRLGHGAAGQGARHARASSTIR